MSVSQQFFPNLTRTENKVLELIVQIKTNKEIGRLLGISPATVKRHVENILRKLNLRNRLEAAIHALALKKCPRGSSSECPLELWRKAACEGEKKWAS